MAESHPTGLSLILAVCWAAISAALPAAVMAQDLPPLERAPGQVAAPSESPQDLPVPRPETLRGEPSAAEDSAEESYGGWSLVDDEPLPPLEEELRLHGGSYLYEPEGDLVGWPGECHDTHTTRLRLPECWSEPRPCTAGPDFLGADPILLDPSLRWWGCDGYVWEPRFVGHGSYQLFAFAREENRTRQDVFGHQLILDLDLRLTGTERFHIQHRPIGRENTGGSFYQFRDPPGYIDNSTAEPDRYWFEAELHSLLGYELDPLAALDYNLTVGRVPLVLHNRLLVNDEMQAVILNKNTIVFGQISNMNLQAIYGFGDVSAFNGDGRDMLALHASADHQRNFYEATYAFVTHRRNAARNSHYLALSRTALLGPTTLALRGLFQWGDEGDTGGTGAGQLFAAEWQCVRIFDCSAWDVEQGVFYCNTFLSTQGWESIAGGNFDRLSVAFELNPLVRIAAAPRDAKVWGVAVGAQLFRHHEDESFIPELAFEDQNGEPAIGAGLRWLRKVGSRSFVEVTGLINRSDDPTRNREAVAVSHTVIF